MRNDINVQVYELLEDLAAYGMKSSPRGQQVVEANVATLDIDPKRPIMEFTERKFNWKYFAGEVAWYLGKERSINFITKFSTFWNNVQTEGMINSNYGDILLNDHPSTRDMKDSSGKDVARVNQLKWVYDSLVKDKDTRQAVAFLNCPYFQWTGNKDFVCTMYLNFWIRHNKLDMKVQMRSNDIFFGLTYDAPWFSLLHQSMYLNLKKHYPELQLGMYYHCADNIHYYGRHFELVEKLFESPAGSSPEFEMKVPLFGFNDTGLFLTPEAESFMENVKLVADSETFKNMKYADWKKMFSELLNISA